MSYVLKNVIATPIKDAKNLTISSGYVQRKLNGKTSFHKALDIVTGTKIVAVADGIVESSRNIIKGYDEKNSSGNFVQIKHDSGIVTYYCHMKYGSVKVKKGDKIKKGDILGIKGATGYAFGAHLHFAVKVNNKFVDPTDYLIGTRSFDDLPIKENQTQIEKNQDSNQSQDYLIYTIKKGDTLSQIALNYDCSVSELATINNITNPNLIITGKSIKIPLDNITTTFRTKYTVKRGDNLFKIAQKYNTTWKKIYEKNKGIIGKNPNLIIPGQVLEI